MQLVVDAFAVRRHTTVAQKDVRHFMEKPVSDVDFVNKTVAYKKKKLQNIIAMDETAVGFDMAGPTTVDKRDIQCFPLKSTGHKKESSNWGFWLQKQMEGKLFQG